jgi:hypothetical protein
MLKRLYFIVFFFLFFIISIKIRLKMNKLDLGFAILKRKLIQLYIFNLKHKRSMLKYHICFAFATDMLRVCSIEPC